MSQGLDIPRLLARLATESPVSDAVVDDHCRVDRAALQRRVRSAVAGLTRLGVPPGARFGVQLGNHVDTLAVYLAGWSRGSTPVNVNRRYRMAEVVGMMRDHDLMALVTEPDRLEELRDPVAADGAGIGVLGPDGLSVVQRAADRAGGQRTAAGYLLMTGGTTGTPRPVAWTMHDIVAGAMYPRSHPDISPDSDVLISRSMAMPAGRTLVAAPMDHAFGQWMAFAVLLAGGTVVLTDRRPLDPEHLLDLVVRQRCDTINVAGQAFVARIVEALDGGAARPAMLQHLVTGGAPTLDPTKRALWQWLPDVVIVEGIGASETGTLGRVTQRPDMVGDLTPRFRPTPGTLIVDDDLKPVAAGAPGRLARTGSIGLGYADDRGDGDRFVTVDGVRMAVLDDAAALEQDGTFVLRGRLDRVINSGGEKVHPAEVEGLLAQHPDVEDCVVLGEPHAVLGQQVVAVVRTSGGGIDAEGVAEYLRGHVAGYKVPRRIVVVPEIPRLDSGKVDLEGVRAAMDGPNRTVHAPAGGRR